MTFLTVQLLFYNPRHTFLFLCPICHSRCFGIREGHGKSAFKSIHDWKKVLFSDETRYKMYSSDGMKRVRRPVTTRIPDSISSTLHLQLNMEGGVFSYRVVFRGME
jgi:hypothetical protein